MKPITTIRIVKRGKPQWYFNVPLHVRGEVGKARLFYPSEIRAKRGAAIVEAIRSDHLAGFEMMGAEDRALAGR